MAKIGAISSLTGLLVIYTSFVLSTGAIAEVDRQQAVVYIQIVDGTTQKRKDLGSGFLAGLGGYILTAKHVIYDTYDFTKDNSDSGDKILVSLMGRDQPGIPAAITACGTRDIDFCVLRIKKDAVIAARIRSVFQLSCRQPAAKEKISVIGFPYGDDSPRTETPEIVTSDQPGALSKYYMSAITAFGMSGGPVVDFADRAIGVNYGVDSLTKSIGLFQSLASAWDIAANVGVTETCELGTKDVQQVEKERSKGEGGAASPAVIQSNESSRCSQNFNNSSNITIQNRCD